jgi:MFS family permease
MIKKSLLVSALTFLIFSVVLFLTEGPNEVAREFPVQFFFLLLFYAAVPFIAIGFVVLITFNLVLEKLIENKPQKQKVRYYWLLGAASSLLPIFGFVFYDISGYGKYCDLPFFQVLLNYSPFFILSFVALFLNSKIVWKNFKNN